MKTSKKRGRVPPEGKKFSKDYQPPPENKSLGKISKKKGQELAKAVLELAFKGMKNSELKKLAAEYFGVKESEITVEMMLHFRQAEKAIQKADTNAYNSVMNRAFGMPKQDIESKNFNVNSVDLTEEEIKKYRKALEDDI